MNLYYIYKLYIYIYNLIVTKTLDYLMLNLSQTDIFLAQPILIFQGSMLNPTFAK